MTSTWSHAYIHTCTDTYIHTYIHACICIRRLGHSSLVAAFESTMTSTWSQTYIHRYIHTCIHACMCINTYMHACMHAYAYHDQYLIPYIHTCIDTYMHINTYILWPQVIVYSFQKYDDLYLIPELKKQCTDANVKVMAVPLDSHTVELSHGWVHTHKYVCMYVVCVCVYTHTHIHTYMEHACG